MSFNIKRASKGDMAFRFYDVRTYKQMYIARGDRRKSPVQGRSAFTVHRSPGAVTLEVKRLAIPLPNRKTVPRRTVNGERLRLQRGQLFRQIRTNAFGDSERLVSLMRKASRTLTDNLVYEEVTPRLGETDPTGNSG
jgi:hypothetical protein